MAGCSAEEEVADGDNPTRDPNDYGDWTIEEARSFDKFTLYWLGESYDGFPLTRIIRTGHTPPPGIVGGTPNPQEDGGCTPPLSIRIEPYCTRPPEIFAQSEGFPHGEVRGVKALVGQSQVTIWSGDVTITVFTNQASKAANDLMAIDESGPRSSEPLPAARPEDCPASAQ